MTAVVARRAAHAEWIKLRTVRSGRWTFAALLVVTVGVGVGVGMLVSYLTGRAWDGTDRSFDPTNLSLSGLAFGQLAVGTLGALVTSGEHSTGLIRSTLAAIPDRRVVLAAKAAVFGGVALVAGELVSFATFLAGQAMLGAAPHAGLGDPGVLRAVTLSGAYLALVGLFGLGIGAVVRHTAGAVATVCALLLVLPPLLGAFPGHAWRFAPEGILSSSVAATVPEPYALGPVVGFALMAGYAVVALAAGALRLTRRDA